MDEMLKYLKWQICRIYLKKRVQNFGNLNPTKKDKPKKEIVPKNEDNPNMKTILKINKRI